MAEQLEQKIDECEIKYQLEQRIRKEQRLYDQQELDCYMCEKHEYQKCSMYVPRVKVD